MGALPFFLFSSCIHREHRIEISNIASKKMQSRICVLGLKFFLFEYFHATEKSP